jgi:phage gp45-like
MFFNSDIMDVIRFIIAKETVFLKQWEGVVLDNLDPDNLGRVKVQIPELLQFTPDQIPWASPEHGLSTVVPPPGKSVVVYFLKGDPAHPIYRGGTSERRDTRLQEYKSPTTAVLYEDDNILLLWDRLKKAFLVKTSNEVTIDAPRVIITGGQLTIDGNVVPNPEGRGALCGLPFCAFSAAPQVGNIASGT